MSMVANRCSRSCFRWRALAAFGIGLLCSSTGVRASTVEAMSLGTLADLSGQVLIGEIASVRSFWAENPRRIETEITFRNVTFLKGRLTDSGDTFSLIVPGGTVGDTSMRICCAPQFKTGTRHLLFLLPTYKTFPTAGLDQGAFEIVRDSAGVDRVYQGALRPVTGIDNDGFVLLGGARRVDPHRHLAEANGAVIRAIDRTQAGESAAGMSLADFIACVQPILNASREHRLTEPAGRRELVELRAVPLKEAAGAAERRQTAGKPDRRQSAQRGSAEGNVAPQITTERRAPVERDDARKTNSAKTGDAEQSSPSRDDSQAGGGR